jgi:putative transposase
MQFIIGYKAKLNGLNVVHVDPRHTSSLCPICGAKLSPNGYRQRRCKCGFEGDRDTIAVKNLLKRYVGSSPVHPESLPMKRGKKIQCYGN